MLEEIVLQKKEELKTLVLPDKNNVPHYSLKQALTHPHHILGLIAEVKKASPSKGVFVEDFHPLDIARAYETSKADAISCLTDQKFFQGHRDYLAEIKRDVHLPVLRKDFIIDERQVEESARMGADAILLIAAILDPTHLHELYLKAQENEMEALVEIHTIEELESVLSIFEPEIIGVNNRKLQTFDTNLVTTEFLASTIPDHIVTVSESGIRTAEDIKRLSHLHINGVLVGETLMKATTPEEGIQSLFGEIK